MKNNLNTARPRRSSVILSFAVSLCLLAVSVTSGRAAQKEVPHDPLVLNSFRGNAVLTPKQTAAVAEPSASLASGAVPETVSGADMATFIPGTIYRLSLPPEVQLGFSASAKDIAVFNAAEIPLSRELRSSGPSSNGVKQYVLRDLFPLYHTEKATSHKNITDDDLTFMVAVTRDGKLVPRVMATAEESAPEVTKKLMGYVAMLPQEGLHPQRISFQWTNAASASARFSLATGDDLVHWRMLENNAMLTRIQGPSGTLETNTVSLRGASLGKYLRILFEPGYEPATVEEISFEQNAKASESTREWRVPIAGQPAADVKQGFPAPLAAKKMKARELQKKETKEQEPKRRGLVFALSNEEDKGDITLRALTLDGMAPGDFYGVNVYLRQSGQDFRLLGKTYLFSAVQEGRTFQNDPLFIDNRQVCAIWLEPTGPADLPDSLRLSLGYQPLDLYFMAKGAMPYTLAWGGNVAPQEQPPLSSLSGEFKPSEAIAGEIVVAKTQPASIEKPATESPGWKRWLVWGLLGLAAALLLLMAFQISRSMKKETPPKG